MPIFCCAWWFSASVDCLSLTSCVQIITCKYAAQTLLDAGGIGADVGDSRKYFMWHWLGLGFL